MKTRNLELPPPDPQIIKRAASERNLVKGLKALADCWKRGLLPDELKRHYFMTWFAYCNGNARRLGPTIGLNRNTIIFIFREKLKRPSTFQLRKIWRGTNSQKAGKPFTERVGELHSRVFKTPKLSKADCDALTYLWLGGFPRKVIRDHYVLWAYRNGLSHEEIWKRLGIKRENLFRIRSAAARKYSLAGSWLAPLKPTSNDWFPKGIGGRPHLE